MSGLVVSSTRPLPRPRPGQLLVITGALAVAVMLVPWPMASWATGTSWTGPADLARAVGRALALDWSSAVALPGEGASALADPTRFWRWFHLVKALLAACVLAASVLLAALAWPSARSASTRARRAGAVLLGLASSGLAAVAYLMVIANVQGAVAPLSSVLSFLATGSAPRGTREAAEALQADARLAHPSALTQALVHDFTVYHVVVAALAAVTTVAAGVLGVLLWRRRRRVLAAGLLTAALAFAILAAANLSTALDPAPALESFLRGVAG